MGETLSDDVLHGLRIRRDVAYVGGHAAFDPLLVGIHDDGIAIPEIPGRGFEVLRLAGCQCQDGREGNEDMSCFQS
jgi:hypothetical protein